MKKNLIAAPLILSLLVATAHAQAPAADHAAMFAQYEKVVNAADLAGLRALISDDVERSNYNACTPAMSNKDCLAFYIENTVFKNKGKVTGTPSFGVDGDTFYAGLELRSTAITAAGSERIVGIDKIKVKGGKIAGLWFLPNLGDAQTKRYFDRVLANSTPSAQPSVLGR